MFFKKKASNKLLPNELFLMIINNVNDIETLSALAKVNRYTNSIIKEVRVVGPNKKNIPYQDMISYLGLEHQKSNLHFKKNTVSILLFILPSSIIPASSMLSGFIYAGKAGSVISVASYASTLGMGILGSWFISALNGKNHPKSMALGFLCGAGLGYKALTHFFDVNTVRLGMIGGILGCFADILLCSQLNSSMKQLEDKEREVYSEMEFLQKSFR